MIYDIFLKYNEIHRENFKECFGTHNLRYTSLGFVYKIKHKGTDYYLENLNKTNSRKIININSLIRFFNIDNLKGSSDMNYITNVNILSKLELPYVVDNFILDEILLMCTHNLNKLCIKEYTNVECYIPKFILLGGKIIFHADNIFLVGVCNNVLYFISSTTICNKSQVIDILKKELGIDYIGELL